MQSNDDLGTAKAPLKLVIVTGIWQRHDVFKMFAEGINILQSAFNGEIDIICCASGSEGENSRKLVERYGFRYIETANKPLSKKMNAAVTLARSFNPDYCLMLGSDDIIGTNLMKKYIELMKKGIDYSGLLDCYFFDTKSKRGLYWAGYRKENNKGMLAGIGRLISRNLLDKIDWLCWPHGYDHVLDTGFEKQLKGKEFSKVNINLKEENLFALDIKSSVNMTPFMQWDNTVFVDGKELLFKNLPEQIANQIYGN